MAVRRSTAKGLSVAARTAAISAAMVALFMVPAPRQPKPPASETAATSSEYETPPMPANMTGYSTPSSSVRRVRMGPLVLLAVDPPRRVAAFFSAGP